ncbi:MAG: tyrosine-type recombinase/integrase [Planctomycetota bacterium]|nr:tyrosine-type recombinase/integrase [Planctomycetota bacterium]
MRLSTALTDALNEYRIFLNEAGRAPQTIEGYIRDIRLVLKIARALFGSESVSEIAPQQLEHILNSDEFMSVDSGRRSKSSVNRTLSSIRGFFRWASEHCLADKDATRSLRSERVRRSKPTVLTADEVRKLLDTTLQEPGMLALRDHMIILTYVRTGIRVNELVELDIEDMDLPGRRLIVEGSKDDSKRVLFLSNKLVESYEQYLWQMWLRYRACEGALFLSNRRKRITSRQVAIRLKHWCREAGIEEISPLVLRHTFASLLFERTHDLGLVQKALGHKDIRTTEIYSYVEEEKLKRAIESL